MESKTVQTVMLNNIPSPKRDPFDTSKSTAATADDSYIPPGTKILKFSHPFSSRVSEGSINITLKLPDGYHLTKGAGSGFMVQVQGQPDKNGSIIIEGSKNGIFSDTTYGDPQFKIVYKFQGSVAPLASTKILRIMNKIYFCKESGPCLFQQVSDEWAVLNNQTAPFTSNCTIYLYCCSTCASFLHSDVICIHCRYTLMSNKKQFMKEQEEILTEALLGT